MASKFIYPVVAIAGIAVASGAAWWLQNKPASASVKVGSDVPASPGAAAAAAAGPGRPVTVEAAKVETMHIADDMQAVGNLRSRQGVVLRPEVSGRITQLNFRDGERVRKGQLLVQFDDQLPQAQVKQSQAELSIATANHKRNQELASQNFISMRSVEESAANLEVAQAKLALAQATAARLKILAPFDGITGIRLVNVGDYLKDGSDVVNIEDIDAIYADFRLPERFQTKVRIGQKASVVLDALPGRKFVATLQAIDPLIDANGRSVGVRGCIDNRQLQLRPGMFARVNVVFGERDNALVVPEEAIVPQGARLFVIRLDDGPDGTRISQRVEVKVGLRKPGQVEIVEGLKAGDSVITAGQQRVQKDGTVVRVVDVGKPGGGRPGGPGGAGGPGGPGAGPGGNTQGERPGSALADGKPVMSSGDAGPRSVQQLATKGGKPVPVGKASSGPNPCLAGMPEGAGPGKGAGRPGGTGAAGRKPA
ncbi:MAG: efflux RND transporter periplasmic adaptor subunit [Gammaproteobacteria bacterium]|nr:efflux RND transporter periplasmic adaptor subunit [Gammaproteobacteria bacterium]MBU0786057.1 efflux RND transporter periplasmic adaptor subunit [Gammaproteobacteria bacterium]MBU0816637.1 efflux RND transporter periplasmic adaptor subunit [Gammaproteobacteria bacterium]MBU1786801.1 efflux RND transporter periplasmic adaptor subunit [Gammaproteobacteria bacterium]